MTWEFAVAPGLASELAAVLQEDVPWEDVHADGPTFLAHCEDHGLVPLVARRIGRAPFYAAWPGCVREALASGLARARARALVDRSELRRVLAALTGAGVEALLMKGAALAYSHYDGPGLRPRRDTDLLVARAQVDVVRQVMADLGYRRPNFSGEELLFCQFPLVRRDRFEVEHVFDVHWHVSPRKLLAGLITFDELRASAVPVPALGAGARAIGDAHALTLACLHPIVHHRGSSRLIWLYDVHLLASRASDGALREFVRFAERQRIAAICVRTLTLAQACFHASLPDELMARLRDAARRPEPTAGFLHPNRQWHHDAISDLRALPSWPDRLRLLREILVPTPSYMLDAYGVRRGGAGRFLLPALYAHRGARGAWRVLSGRK